MRGERKEKELREGMGAIANKYIFKKKKTWDQNPLKNLALLG